MASTLAEALNSLEPLEADTYITAFGPAGEQFCASPNGYGADQLPAAVCQDLMGGRVQKVLCASFGSEPRSFFFSYKTKTGGCFFRIGPNVPPALMNYLRSLSSHSARWVSQVRVQLGANGSFLAWVDSFWIASGIPYGLLRALSSLSSMDQSDHQPIPTGFLTSETLKHVTWDKSGAYFIKADRSYWLFLDAVEQAWNTLWCNQLPTPESIAHVYLDPHSLTGENFVLIKVKPAGAEPDFILRFKPHTAVSRVAPIYEILNPKPANLANQADGLVESDDDALPSKSTLRRTSANMPNFTDSQPADPAMHTVSTNLEDGQVYRWARSACNGRPHAMDRWELNLEMDERLKVLQDMGNQWFLVQNAQGCKGWAHSTSLALDNVGDAYARWEKDMNKLAAVGSLCTFPNVAGYMKGLAVCGREDCQYTKRRGLLGICGHDLRELMSGSGRYSLGFLKEQRNMWHPDRFGRFCQPEHRAALSSKAEALFVLFGVLMDWMEN